MEVSLIKEKINHNIILFALQWKSILPIKIFLKNTHLKNRYKDFFSEPIPFHSI